MKPLGYLKVSSLSAAAGLTVPASANRALMRVEGQSIRWRDDGTDPTASEGVLLSPGQAFMYDGVLTSFKAIEIVASATLYVSFYREI
jgi:hypothetical protein